MAHRRELIIEAVADTISIFPSLSAVDVAHDREYAVELSVVEAIDVIQGADNMIQYLMNRYVDSELEFSVLLQVKANVGVRPATLLNELAVKVVQALKPQTNGDLGIAGASNLTEVGTTAIEFDEDQGEMVSAYMTMSWTIQYRRDMDDPSTLT